MFVTSVSGSVCCLDNIEVFSGGAAMFGGGLVTSLEGPDTGGRRRGYAC